MKESEHIKILARSLDKNNVEWKLEKLQQLEKLSLPILNELLEKEILSKKELDNIRTRFKGTYIGYNRLIDMYTSE